VGKKEIAGKETIKRSVVFYRGIKSHPTCRKGRGDLLIRKRRNFFEKALAIDAGRVVNPGEAGGGGVRGWAAN